MCINVHVRSLIFAQAYTYSDPKIWMVVVCSLFSKFVHLGTCELQHICS
jgi:hypothetical protein